MDLEEWGPYFTHPRTCSQNKAKGRTSDLQIRPWGALSAHIWELWGRCLRVQAASRETVCCGVTVWTSNSSLSPKWGWCPRGCGKCYEPLNPPWTCYHLSASYFYYNFTFSHSLVFLTWKNLKLPAKYLRECMFAKVTWFIWLIEVWQPAQSCT